MPRGYLAEENHTSAMNILVIKRGALGDMIAGTSTLIKLREKFPNARIVLLGDNLSQIVCPAGTIADDVIDIRSYKNSIYGIFTLLRFIRRQKFEIAINLRWKSDLASILTILSGAKIRLGGGRSFYTRFYTGYDESLFVDENRHEYLIHVDILRPLGIEPTNIRTYVHVSETDRAWATSFLRKHALKKKQFLLVTPIASNPQKAWKPANYVEIITRFQKRYRAKTVLSYAPNDADAIAEIVQKTKGDIVLTGATTVGQLAALVECARLVLCNNSGIIHVAYAVGTPVLCLNTSLGWAPFGRRDAAITRIDKNLPIAENRHLPNDEVEKLLATISVDEVFTLLNERWRKLAPTKN